MILDILKKRYLIILGVLLLTIQTVRADYFGLPYSLADVYLTYFEWFDVALYFAIFGSLTRAVFEKRFA